MTTKRHNVTLDGKILDTLTQRGIVTPSGDGRLLGLSSIINRCMKHCVDHHIENVLPPVSGDS